MAKVAIEEGFKQLGKNVVGTPGWFPLIVTSYVVVPRILETIGGSSATIQDHGKLVAFVVGLLLYVVGDALYKAVFPRESGTGLKWLSPQSLDSLRDKAREVLDIGIPTSIYAVCKSLAVARGSYEGLTQFMNEFAKFLRSLVIPSALVGFVLIFGEHPWEGVMTLIGSIIGLWAYARLKGLHMCRLYCSATLLMEMGEEEKERSFLSISDLECGIRLFFWKGKFTTSGLRPSVAARVPAPGLRQRPDTGGPVAPESVGCWRMLSCGAPRVLQALRFREYARACL